MNKELCLPLGTTEIAPGWHADVEIDDPFENISPGSTANHEADHAGVALFRRVPIKLVTRKSGPGYLGKTEVGFYDPVVFAAAEADGCDGTGHDMKVIALFGDSPSLAVMTARSYIIGKKRALHGIACAIEVNGTISGAEVEQAAYDGENPQAATVIINPLGEKIAHFTSRTKDGKEVSVPSNILQLLPGPNNEFALKRQQLVLGLVA